MTDLEAANRALTFLGVEPIGSLNDNGKPARTMNALLPLTKKTVLTEFPWSFATQFAALSPAGGSPPAGYSRLFAYPSGALAVRRVYANTDFKGVAEFLRVGTAAIAANIEGGTVEYTADMPNLDQWPIHVAECLAVRLASDAAVALTGMPDIAGVMMQKYMLLAQEAAQVSVVEGRVPPRKTAQYADARK
jgi:hypothetical protein